MQILEMQQRSRCCEDSALRKPGTQYIHTKTHTLSPHTLTVLDGTGVFIVAVASEAPEEVETVASSGITPLLSKTLKRQTARETVSKRKCVCAKILTEEASEVMQVYTETRYIFRRFFHSKIHT